MTGESLNTVSENRIYFLDNLRTFIIFLVVFVHSAIVYESSTIAAYFWIVYDTPANYLVGLLISILDIIIMPTIFFISGYFTPLSLKNKGDRTFVITKFKRLILPWIIAVLTLMPAYKFIFLYSRGLPQESWTTYFHWSNGIFSQSWLWFLPVLFLFDMIYLLLSKINITIPQITMKRAVWSVFILGFLYNFGMDIFNGLGWTKTILLDFQNEKLLVYLLIFFLGAVSYKQKIFETKWKNKRLYKIVFSILWIPLCIYLILFINTYINFAGYIFSEIADTFIMRLTLHLLLLGSLYLLVNTFRYYFNKEGKIRKVLNRNSYSVYIIHVIVLGAIALILLNTTIPPLIKILLLTFSTYAVSNLIIYYYRKVVNLFFY